MFSWLFRGSKQLDRIERMVASIKFTGEKVMSAFSDYAAKQKSFNTRMESSVQGIGSDVTALNDKITELQNSPGKVTPEDQALLDELQAAGEALATRFEALDALTPPAIPADPGGPPVIGTV